MKTQIIPRSRVSIRVPVISFEMLQVIGSTQFGISIHKGIIVVWDEDYDTRIITVINERFKAPHESPLAVCEHEGSLSILWDSEFTDPSLLRDDYVGDGDQWSTSHYYVKDGVVVEFTELQRQ